MGLFDPAPDRGYQRRKSAQTRSLADDVYGPSDPQTLNYLNQTGQGNKDPSGVRDESMLKQFGDAISGNTGYRPQNSYITSDPALAQNPVLLQGGQRIDQSRGALAHNVLAPGSGLTQDLVLASRGIGPTAAQAQLDAANAQAMRQQLAMAASARGGAAQQAAAQRQAMFGMGAAGQANARSAADLRAREQQAAQGLLSQQLGTQGNLQLQQQRADFELAKQNQDAQLQRQQMNKDIEMANAANLQRTTRDAATGIGAMFTMFSDIRGKEDIQPAFTWDPNQNAIQEIAARPDMRPVDPYAPQPAAPGGGESEGVMGKVGDVFSAFGGGFPSDERTKHEITRLRGALQTLGALSEDDIDRLNAAQPNDRAGVSRALQRLATPEGSRRGLAPVDAYSYRYKPDVAAQYGEDTAPRLGVMAQEMERSPYLRSAVVEKPDGTLGIDGSRGLSASLAGVAGLDKRQRQTEEELARLKRAAAMGAMTGAEQGLVRGAR